MRRFLSSIQATPGGILLAYALVLTAAMLCAGCAGPGLGVSAQQIAEAAKAAAADGIITPEEQAALKQMVSPGIDWVGSLALVGSSVLAALTGIKIIPTRVLQGPWDPKPQPTTPA